MNIFIKAKANAILPYYASAEAAGADISACIDEDVVIQPGSKAAIPTGLFLAIPEGMEAQIRSRSGLAFHHLVVVLNAPGTIDSDYRGELKILLVNLGQVSFVVTHGMRIAQMIVSPVVRAHFTVVDELSCTVRGEGGFGHTGLI